MVENVQHQGKYVLHMGIASGNLKVGDEVILYVDTVRYFCIKNAVIYTLEPSQ